MRNRILHILLTGGGSGGHIQPNIALARELLSRKSVHGKVLHPTLVCSRNTLDKEIIRNTRLDFIPIWSGKMRRYFDFQNFVDWIFIILGFFQSLWILFRIRPSLVFCKGGYVCVPMAFAAFICRVPLISHESDTVSGLANRIIGVFSKIICTGFPLKGNSKYLYTGNPLRNIFLDISLENERKKGYAFTGFNDDMPVILVMGGSQGAQFINNLVQEILPKLMKKYQVIHITGKDKNISFSHEHYRQYSYVEKEMPSLYAITEIAVLRAGASSLAELAFFRIPSLLIPLPSSANNHQYINACFFEERGGVILLNQNTIKSVELLEKIDYMFRNRAEYTKMQAALQELSDHNATKKIMDVMMKMVG